MKDINFLCKECGYSEIREHDPNWEDSTIKCPNCAGDLKNDCLCEVLRQYCDKVEITY